MLAQAWQYYYHFNIEGVLRNMDKVEELGKEEASTKNYAAEIAMFRGYSAYFMAQGQKSLEYIEFALQHIGTDDVEFRSQSEILFGLAAQMENQLDEVVKRINGWLDAPSPLHPLRESCLLWTLAFTLYIDGNFKASSKYVARLDDVSRVAKIDNFFAWSNYLKGLIAMQKGKIKKGIRFLELAEKNKYAHFTRASVDSLATLSYLYIYAGKPKMCHSTMENLQMFNVFLGRIYDELYTAVEARNNFISGNHNESLLWAYQSEFSPIEGKMSWFIQPDLIKYRILIEAGTPKSLRKTIDYLEKAKEVNESHNNKIQLISILNLIALAYEKMGMAKEACNEIVQSLKLASMSSIEFPFLELGKQMEIILEKVDNEEVGQLKLSILNHFKTLNENLSILHNNSQSTKKDMLINLTRREKEILQLMAKGFRNKEIANQLFISVDTVKKHLKSCYSKLDVHNRIQAAQKAEFLGVLP